MKIVINRCYGGFGLSTEAIKELIKLGCPGVKKMSVKEYYGGSGIDKKWKDSYEKDLAASEDGGDGYLVRGFFGTIIKDGYTYAFENHDNKYRNCPILIKVVQKLGQKKVSGQFAKLEIVEIPDNVKWEISEYDGFENVDEVHRSWP